MAKIILHLDMNSYFASVEQQANPHLRGRPVGVCEHLGGLIIAPSVEAKRLGIKLGTPVWEAKKIYPEIVLLPVDPPKYRQVTASFLRILSEYTDDVERASIDEAFADISAVCRDFDEALLVGLEIKQRLRREIGEWVSCSIGIGSNKLLAKIAADLGEGDIDRIFVIKPEEVGQLYERLQLTQVPGIGRRLERRLQKLGIRTLRQLAIYPLSNLLNQFGILGFELHGLANFDFLNFVIPALSSPRTRYGEPESRKWIPWVSARDDKEIWNYGEIKSMGHSYTLSKPISELSEIKKLMYKLAEKIGRRLRRKGASGNIVHYFHSDKRYEGFSKQHKIQEYINDGREIYKAAWGIFKKTFRPSSALGGSGTKYSLSEVEGVYYSIKIMGISVSGLSFMASPPVLLSEYQKPQFVVQAMDKINDKYGEFTLQRARLLGMQQEWGKDTIGFGRMKEFPR